MLANQQNLLSAGIILVVCLIVGWLSQTPPNQPTGLLSLNETAKLSSSPYSVDEVKIYQTLPPGATVVGEVTVEFALNPREGEQQQVQELVSYARTKAGDAGANGIVVEMVAQRGAVWYFAGKVIRI